MRMIMFMLFCFVSDCWSQRERERRRDSVRIIHSDFQSICRAEYRLMPKCCSDTVNYGGRSERDSDCIDAEGSGSASFCVGKIDENHAKEYSEAADAY
jgi:hypothetical protein